MRAFVAVNLPGALRAAMHDALAPLRERARSVRWIDSAALHITLQFLGTVEDGRADAIAAAVARAARDGRAFQVRAATLGAFPNLRRARLWWIGADAGALPALQSAVAGQLRPLGFEPEARPFHPHITVARAPRDVHRQDVATIESAAATFTWTGEARVETIELMQSHLGRGGARYEAVASVPLGG